MATQARAPKKSAKQVAAGKAYAAGGRAAQAAALHSSNPKTAAAAHRKRQQASRKAAATRARNKSLAKAGKKVPTVAQKRAAPAPPDEELVELPGYWLKACNDIRPVCAAAAVANSLYIETGLAMDDADILKLHRLAGGDEGGATIESVLEAVTEYKSQFSWGSRATLVSFTPTDLSVIVSGLVVGIQLPHAGHAVLTTAYGMVSWGRVLPFAGEPEEAWALEWGPGDLFYCHRLTGTPNLIPGS